MKNILITGGSGFIGSMISIKLIEKGYNVRVLDNLSKQIHGENPEENSFLYNVIKNKVEFIKGDVTNRNDWEKSIMGQDAIIHLAAETGTGQSMYQIEHYTKVNVNGTSILLDILANTKHSIKKIIIASSRSIYGEGKYHSNKHGIIFPKHRSDLDMQRGIFDIVLDDELLECIATDEDSKIHPSSVYGITKQNQEQMILTVCPTIGISPVAFRYQNVYGPGQSLSNPYTGILSIFSTLISNNTNISIFEDGMESRDFVYIDDVVRATILGLENNEANGEVFNVGSGIPTSVLEVAENLRNNFNSSVEINITGNYRLGDIRHNYADLTKINKILGFNPEYDFKKGLNEFTNWVKTQNINKSNYSDSINEMKEKGLLK